MSAEYTESVGAGRDAEGGCRHRRAVAAQITRDRRVNLGGDWSNVRVSSHCQAKFVAVNGRGNALEALLTA